jgi:hypothetical protein
MDTKTLLAFTRRILSSSSTEKATISLNQLQRLLEEQGAPKSHILLLQKVMLSVPEMKQQAQNGTLSEADIEIAYRRARERIAREEAAMRYGRC